VVPSTINEELIIGSGLANLVLRSLMSFFFAIYMYTYAAGFACTNNEELISGSNLANLVFKIIKFTFE